MLCFVLGPSTAFYRSFLKYCTLTNKAVGITWRDLSKPPQRRQGPDPHPLWLFGGTLLALGHELASRRGDVFLHIFEILFLSPYMCMYARLSGSVLFSMSIMCQRTGLQLNEEISVIIIPLARTFAVLLPAESRLSNFVNLSLIHSLQWRLTISSHWIEHFGSN